MARRRGSIQKRGLNKYLVRVYVGMERGKRKYVSRTVNGTWEEADQELTKMLREYDTKTLVSPSKETLGEYLEGWLNRKEGIEAVTLNTYRARIERDVIPYIGQVRLQDVTADMLERLYRELQGDGARNPIPMRQRLYVKEDRNLSPRTILYTHTVLRQALGQAHRRGRIGKNPADLVENKPKLTKTQGIQVLTGEQVGTLLKWSEGHQSGVYHTLWLILLSTGMRPNEALALQRDCVDLDRGVIYVRRAFTRVTDTKWELKEYPKTSSSRRQIPIHRVAVEALRKHLKDQAVAHLKKGIRTEFVFVNQAGNPLDLPRVRRRWKQACERSGVPVIRLYDTRHTHATLLLLAGENPKVVSERLGHSTIRMTLDTYSHVIPAMQEKAVERFGAAVGW